MGSFPPPFYLESERHQCLNCWQLWVLSLSLTPHVGIYEHRLISAIGVEPCGPQ
jgi:hypothetical protein